MILNRRSKQLKRSTRKKQKKIQMLDKLRKMLNKNILGSLMDNKSLTKRRKDDYVKAILNLVAGSRIELPTFGL